MCSPLVGSQRKEVGVISGEGAIEQPFSTYSAPFGTCWQPSGKLHSVVRCAAMLVMLFTIGVGNVWGATVTYSNSDFSGGSSGSNSTLTVTQHSPISVSAVGYKASGHVRFYKGGAMTISGATITKVVFTCTSNDYATALAGFTFSSGSCTHSSTTATWTGSTTSLTITSNAQTRYTQFVVTYTPSAASHTLSSAVSPVGGGTVSLSATSVAQGSTATATATPATHYVFDHWSISGTGSTLSSTTTNPTTVTMGTANTTVTANFVAAPKASITLSEAGATTTDASTYYVGDSYTLPSSTEASCGDKVLVGWSTVEVAETDTKPTSNYYETGASVTLGATQTFYAVFASVTEGTGDWEQCSSSTIADGDYLIVQSDYMMTNTLNSQRFNKTYIAISAGVISYDAKADWSAYTWHIAETSTSGIFTIKNGNNYVIGTGTASKIDLVSTPADDKELFAITYQSTPGTYKIVSKYNEAASVNRWLRYGGTYFACYADGGYPYFFKRGSGYGNYCTTCAVTHTVNAVVDPTGKATVTLGATTVAEDATTTAEYSGITTGYEFVNWSISGTGASLSSTTSNPTTITMGTANVTVTANLRCITPSISVQPAASTSCLVGASPELSVTAAAGGASLSYQWKQCATIDGVYSNVASGGTSSTYSPSTASAGTTYYKCVITNAASGCSANVTSDAAQVTVNTPSNFPNNKTIFIQAHSTSAWTGGGCVKAWFHTAGGSEAAQTTYWLFDAGSPDEGKKLFAAIVPSTGNLPYLDIQRFAANCSDWWNKNGGCSYSDADGSNAIRSTGKHDDSSEGDYVRWNDDAVTLSLYGDPNSWGSSLASFSDQGNGVWTATYSNYAPANAAGESQDFKICTNYNGWIGNTGSNNNVTVDGMHVGSTYDIGASLDIKTHTLTLTKTYVKGTVHFDMQSHGSAISDLTNVAAGSKISAPSPAPTAAGYRFVGWYKEPACTNAWNFGSDVVNETMTLYAKWVQIFTVTYNSNGGSGSMTDSNSPYDSGATVTVKSNSFTAPTGKEFNHWDTKDDDTGTDYAPAATFTISANTTLYAQWSFVNYNVTYSAPSNGNYTIKVADGSATSATKTANYGQTITIAATPNSSFRFGSWTIRNTSTSADVTSTLLTGDKPTTASTTFTMPAYGVTITATFVQTHTVTWSVNGATASAASLGLASNPVVYDNGGTLALPPTDPDAPSGCSSKVFVGWTSDSEITTETSTEPSFISAGGAVNADVTYRAVFADEGAGGTKWVRKEVTSGFSLSDVSEGTWALVSSAGYAFNGTISSGHGQKTATSVTFVNNEVAALPTGTCELTFTKVMNGGNIVGYTIYSATLDKYLYATKAASGGLAWQSSETSYWTVTSDNWVYAWNTAYMRVYDNTFRTYAGNNNLTVWLAKKTSDVSYDKYITVCATCTTPTGLAMSNITSTGGKVSWSGVSLSPTEGYKVAWNTSNSVPSPLNSGNSADVDADKSEYTISGLTPATQYYVFVQSKCNSTWSSSTNFHTNAKITYAANGGSGSMDPKEVTYNAASTTVDACTFTAPSGKVFNGWVSSSAVTVDGGVTPTTAVPAGATINNLTAAITLTAQWRDLNTWNITFNANNGTIAGGSPQVATEGSTFTFPNVTSTTCGTFIGWITSSSYSSATKPASFKAAGDTEDIPIGGSPAATTYYAVYAEETAPEPTDDYVLIENEQSDWSGEYLIVSEYTKDAVDYSRAFNGSLTTLDATSNYLDVTISSKTITANSTTNAIKFTIAKVVGQPGKYSVKSASNYYIGNDGASNALASSTGTIYQNTIEYDATNSRIKIKGNNASPTQLAFNSTSGQDRFRYFTTPDSQKDIQLYKKGGGSAYTYKTSPSCSPTVSTSTPASSFTYVYNAGPSASQTFQVSGSNLSTNLVVTAPSNYQVSADNSSFSSSINITPTDGRVATTTVYIRLAAGLNVGSYNGGVITVSSTGADDDVSAALTGSVTKATGSIAFTDFNAVDHYEAEMAAGASSVDVTLTVSVTGDGAVSYSRTPAAGSSAVPATTPTTTLHVTTVGTWTVTANLAAGTNYTSASTNCQVVVYYADRFYDNLHGNSTIVKRNDSGEDHYTIPSLSDESRQTSGTCSQTHYHFMGWVPEAALGSLTDDASYTAVMITSGTQAASGTNYYAVWAEE